MPLEQRHVKSVSKSGDSELKGNITLSEGSNITLTQAGQDIEIAAAGGAAGAPTDAQYVTLAVDGDLSAERVLAGGTGIDIADGGANNNVTLSLDVSELGTEASIAAGDFIVMEDITDNGSQKITFSNLEGTIDHGNLAGLDTGADHSYIDQDVTSGSSPTLDGTNFTGIPDGALDTDYVEVAGDIITGNIDFDDGVGNSPILDFIDGDDDYLRIYKDDDNSTGLLYCSHLFRLNPNGNTGHSFDISSETTPQKIVLTASGTSELKIVSGSGTVDFDNDTIETDGAITVNGTEIVGTDSEVNKAVIEGAPTGDFVGTTDTQTLTNKTLTEPTVNYNDGAPSVNPRCNVYLGTDMTGIVNTTWTKIEFDVENFDTGNDFDATNHRFTAPVSGYYLVTLNVKWNAIDSGRYASCAIYVNESNENNTWNFANSSGATFMSTFVSAVVYAASGQYIEGYAFHANGDNTPQIRDNETGMTIHLLST